MATLLNRTDIPNNGMEFRFEGIHHDNTNVSFFIEEVPPGHGPKLHMHPYEEVFVVQKGNVTFTAGDKEIEAVGGQIVIVPGGVPHKFINSGETEFIISVVNPAFRTNFTSKLQIVPYFLNGFYTPDQAVKVSRQPVSPYSLLIS